MYNNLKFAVFWKKLHYSLDFIHSRSEILHMIDLSRTIMLTQNISLFLHEVEHVKHEGFVQTIIYQIHFICYVWYITGGKPWNIVNVKMSKLWRILTKTWLSHKKLLVISQFQTNLNISRIQITEIFVSLLYSQMNDEVNNWRLITYKHLRFIF